MKTYRIDNGLIVDPSTNPPTPFGYIVSFGERGTFDPSGKVDGLTPEQIEQHNSLLSQMEWDAMLACGEGILYITEERISSDTIRRYVSQWNGDHKRGIGIPSYSFHNFVGPNGRRDYHFPLDGSWWHGVNIGDSQILRVKRTRRPA